MSFNDSLIVGILAGLAVSFLGYVKVRRKSVKANLDYLELLKGNTFLLRDYRQYSDTWDHDHCEVCGAKFSLKEPGGLRRGYIIDNEQNWVCEACFEKSQEQLRWETR